MLSRHAVITFCAVSILAFSFWVTLMVLDYFGASPGEAAAERLSKLSIQNAAGVDELAAKAGLRKSLSIVGAIDGASKLEDGRLRVIGWAFDREKLNEPITVAVLIDGKLVLTAMAKGPRDDVAKGYGLPPTQAQNIAIVGVSKQEISCGRNNIFIAISGSAMFSVLRSDLPIGGC